MTPIEEQICEDPLLSRLDEVLADNYSSMLEADFGGSKASLKAAQRYWIVKRNACKDLRCVIKAYQVRIDETCIYGIATGVHPVCLSSDEVIPESVK